MMRKILCRLGLHRWEREPFHKEYVRSTGLHVLFSSSGIQFGRRRCRCCGHEQDVYREGMVGLGGGSSTAWRRCSPDQKARIEQYPVL